jgi:hypothetical protein
MGTVLQVIKPQFLTPNEFGYQLMTLAHRPEVAGQGADVQDARGNVIDTLVLIANDEGSDGGHSYSIRLASSEVDPLALASEGDRL